VVFEKEEAEKKEESTWSSKSNILFLQLFCNHTIVNSQCLLSH